MGKKIRKTKTGRKKKLLPTMEHDKADEKICKQMACTKVSNGLFIDLDKGNVEGHNSTSLQQSFLKFRKSRQEEIALANEKRRPNCDPVHMLKLRKKFLNRCKKYIGVPYKKKYHKPGSAEYNSNLFLDCCGLVRRVLKDLSKEFGFRIGPWNQAYMFDTLPIAVCNEEEMRPGDLVFISGVYFNTKMRRQLHNMVHVEVWMGEGSKTIGARWHRGRVQVFDSYQFESTSYHSMTYHFRSIDTWLQGVCKRFNLICAVIFQQKSHALEVPVVYHATEICPTCSINCQGSFCDRHPWRRSGLIHPSKRSVFFHGQSGVTCDTVSTRDVNTEENDEQGASSQEDQPSTSSGSKCLVETDTRSQNEEKILPESFAQADDKQEFVSLFHENQAEAPSRYSLTHLTGEKESVTKPPLKFLSFSKAIDVVKESPKNISPRHLEQPVKLSTGEAAEKSPQTLDSFANLRKPLYFFTTKTRHYSASNKTWALKSINGNSSSPSTASSRSKSFFQQCNALADVMVIEAIKSAISEVK